jgi:MAGUK p55 subfamily protein 5
LILDVIINSFVTIGSNLDEIVTYEKVLQFKPPITRKRPIVLIGPHSIGRHELRKRLMQSNPSLYEVAVPHTTRAPRRDEIDGKDYHFIARHIFEADIKQCRFIEHGEFEKNLYGTSSDAIKKVIDNGKICVLNLYPMVIISIKLNF